jgi:hypothetical protein
MADIVAKAFLPSGRVTLIQILTRTRNTDSKMRMPRFNCFKFEFHSDASATFATQSAINGLMHRSKPPRLAFEGQTGAFHSMRLG